MNLIRHKNDMKIRMENMKISTNYMKNHMNEVKIDVNEVKINFIPISDYFHFIVYQCIDYR